MFLGAFKMFLNHFGNTTKAMQEKSLAIKLFPHARLKLLASASAFVGSNSASAPLLR